MLNNTYVNQNMLDEQMAALDNTIRTLNPDGDVARKLEGLWRLLDSIQSTLDAGGEAVLYPHPTGNEGDEGYTSVNAFELEEE